MAGMWSADSVADRSTIASVAQRFDIHPDNPQPRLIRQASFRFRDGALGIYPTDSCYAFGFLLGNAQAAQRITRIRQADKQHNFTLVCRDLSEIAVYAQIENWTYRLLKAHTPGPYTFILRATRELPRRLQNPKKRTVGIRIPDHEVAKALLTEISEPIMSSTLLLPDAELPLNDPDEICERLSADVDFVIASGSCGIEPTTVIDLTGDVPAVLRYGKGSATAFE
jgi:tRNA threonylcarbamoyl adenosine modification protein (Sua5/YciO/YrdC/YwlC family)